MLLFTFLEVFVVQLVFELPAESIPEVVHEQISIDTLPSEAPVYFPTCLSPSARSSGWERAGADAGSVSLKCCSCKSRFLLSRKVRS